MLRLKNICKSYVNSGIVTKVLSDFNLEVSFGEVVGLVGASGSGKSTVLHIAGLLDRADSGSVEVDGLVISDKSDYEKSVIRLKKIGFVYQFHHLISEFTALENVILPMMINNVSKREACNLAEDLLCEVGLENKVNYFPSQLSGGEKQRVAIARSLANKPKFLLADEPTGNLDAENSLNIFNLITKKVKEYNMGALIITHNLHLANMMDTVFKMQ